MTTNDLRKKLDTVRGSVESFKRLIEANQRIIETYGEIETDRRLFLEIRHDIEESNQRLRNTMEAQTVNVRAWAQLISDEDHRQIFIDRYIHGMTWEDIEERHHVSHATVYRINKKNIETIARRTVCDLRPEALENVSQMQQ